MNAEPEEKPVPAAPKTGAGVAGASGGTLVALLASNLSDENVLKPWLLLAAPSLAVFFSGVWLWANQWFSNWLSDREVKTVVAAARADLREALDNPHTTNEHHESLQKRMEALDLMVVDRHFKRIESIKIFSDQNRRSDRE